MRAAFDSNSLALTLAFSDETVAHEFLAETRANGGFQAEVGTRLSQYDVVTVAIELGKKTHEAFKSYVARTQEVRAGSFLTAFVIQDWTDASEREFFRHFEEPLEDAPGAGRVEEAALGEVRGAAAVFQIKKLNPSQKAIRAQRADRSERRVLLRDNAPQVLQGLLVNPRLEAKEVLRIAKSTYATGAILQRIVGDARWGKNQEILAAVVRNPKAPTTVVTRLVDKLRTSDLRQMAKMSSGLKEVVRKAALREYTKRSGQ